jgi:hypothetical protein
MRTSRNSAPPHFKEQCAARYGAKGAGDADLGAPNLISGISLLPVAPPGGSKRTSP